MLAPFSLPAGTPYEGGVFRMKLVLSRDFPTSPPQGFFLTKIFHPNVAKNGAICVNTLKRDWKPDHGIKHILLVGDVVVVGVQRVPVCVILLPNDYHRKGFCVCRLSVYSFLKCRGDYIITVHTFNCSSSLMLMIIPLRSQEQCSKV